MKMLLAFLLLSLVPAGGARGEEPYACNMAALTKAERATHGKVSRRLLGAVEDRRELENGYAFRLPPQALVTAAQWVSLERRCCPFFTFAIEAAKDGGPLWLSVTGSRGIKPFIRDEFGLE